MSNPVSEKSAEVQIVDHLTAPAITKDHHPASGEIISSIEYSLNITNPKYCDLGETEYFNGVKWKKISEYTEGDGVLTWYPDGHAKVEQPLKYINRPASGTYYHYVSGMLDMCLSESQSIVYRLPGDKSNRWLTQLCSQVFANWTKNRCGFNGTVPLSFTLPEKVSISEEMLRVAVMINADGTYRKERVTIDGSCKSKYDSAGLAHDVFDVRVFKPRKIERARMLLTAAGIPFVEKPQKAGGGKQKIEEGRLFRFRFPFNAKHFPEEWIYLPVQLKKAFLEELMYWDGSTVTCDHLPERKTGEMLTVTANRFHSSKKDDVDTVQMIAHSCGRATRVFVDDRYANPNYRVSIKSVNVTKLNRQNEEHNAKHTGRFERVTVDREYGFVTKSGFVILRRNNKICIVGCTCGPAEVRDTS